MLDGLWVARPHAECPPFQSRNMTDDAQHVFHQPILVASWEEVEEKEAEDNDDAQCDTDACCKRQVACDSQCQVDEYAEEPKPEMGEEVHHGI